MRYTERGQQTGGRRLTAFAARWLVDGSIPARCRRAWAWARLRVAGIKRPITSERAERRNPSSGSPAPFACPGSDAGATRRGLPAVLRRSRLPMRRRAAAGRVARLNPARAAAALLPVLTILAACLPLQAQAQTEVWSGTLTVRDLGFGLHGCSNTVATSNCSSRLTDDDFMHDSTDYAIEDIFVRTNGQLELEFDTDLTTATQGLTLNVDGTAFAFEDADSKRAAARVWFTSGLSWSAGDSVSLTLIEPDTTPPGPESAEVPTSGTSIELVFDEALDVPEFLSATLAGAFSVTADGADLPITGVVTFGGSPVRGLLISLTAGTAIDKNQIVTVSYDKTTAGTDALEDDAGNEVATFTDFAATNNSTVDTIGPRPESAEVPAAGTTIQLTFDEALDVPEFLPAALAGAFSVTADGADLPISGVVTFGGSPVSGLLISLVSGTAIYQNQIVTVSYNKTTVGTDALEDDASNEAATFTDFAATNNSTQAPTVPGAPTALMAGGSSETQIDLSWTAPADNGGAAISGYRIEVSADAGTTWTDLDADTGTTSVTYSHTGLTGGTTRHYRVSAINAIGTGAASDVGNATTLAVVNTPAEGKPTISGPAQVGRTLTAATADITDDEGLTSVSYTYQWIAAGTVIAGATSVTYTLTSSEQGDKIVVRVTFDDDEDNPETLISDETIPVAPAAATCPTDAATIWCTTLTVGHHLEEDDGDIGVTEAGYDALYGSLGGATFRHLDVDYTVTELKGGGTIDLYFATTPNLPADGVGLTVHVQKYVGELDTPLADGVFQSDNWFFQGALNTSASSGDTLSDVPLIHAPWSRDQVVPDPPDLGTEVMVRLSFANRPAEGTPTISGTAQVGEPLTAGMGDIADADGLPGTFPGDYTFQWLRVDAGTDSPITGATARTYTPVAADVGKTIKVEVSFTDDGSTRETLTSGAYPSSGTIIDIDVSNTAPVFTGGTNQTRMLAETVGDATVTTASDIGTAVGATDADAGDTLTYSLGGTGAGKFDFDASNGQISTKAGERYDHEANQRYSVTVMVHDGRVSVSAAVTINIANNTNERPLAPDAPTVTSTPGSASSLDVSWVEPLNSGRPGIAGYDLQYRVDGRSSWTDGPQDVSGTDARITGLTAGTSYEVQVRAFNTDGDGAWSSAGEGRTSAPTVRFGASAYTSIEGLAGAVVTVELNPPATRTVTVPVTETPQGGATSADYSGVPGSVTFAAGETEQTFTVTATDDSVDDDRESLQLGFGNLPSGVLLGSPSTATVALVADSGVSTWFLFFAESSYTATEGGAAARVTVGLSSPWKPELNEPLTVGIFAPEHRGGADASDYSGVPERVTFHPGQTRASFTVTATDDSDDDDGESIYLEFTGPDIEDLELGRGPRAATVHLRDDDGAIAVKAFFGEQTYRANEGSTVTVEVHLDKKPGRALTIPITTAHGNGASSADYSGVPRSIVFSGSQSTRTFNVQVQNDSADDDHEYVTFGFGELPASVSAGEPATATLNLVDTGEAVSVRTVYFDAQDTNVRELLEGSIYSLYVYVNRAADNDIVVPLQVERLDGATTADYSGVPETVIIRAGERRENVIIRVLEDTEDDHGEGIRVSLGSLPRGVSKNLRADTATFRFLDNDTVPAISIAGAYVKEWPNPQSYLRFVASLDYAAEFEVTVDYRTVNGSAVAGQDYESESGTLTFAEGERSKYIRVLVCHDGIDESTETMTLQLSNPVRGKLQGTGSATGSIGNNNGSGAKPCSTGISVSDVSAPEPNINHLQRQEIEFGVSLNQADTGTVRVNYSTHDGTATAGLDYESASGTVTFRPGQTRKTVTVVVLADAHDDPGETFTLRLSNPSGAYIGDGEGTATLTNSGPMPGAWLSRFGRVASDHVIEAVGERWQGAPQAPHLRIGGRQAGNLFGWAGLGGQMLHGGADDPGDPGDPVGTEPSSARLFAPSAGAATGVGAMAPETGLNGIGMNGAAAGPGRDERKAGATLSGDAAQGALLRALGLPDPRALPDLRQVLMGSSFFYSAALDENGRTHTPQWLGQWSGWGRTAASRFSGTEDKLTLDGEVATAMLGFDSRWDRWLAGVAISFSDGRGGYTHPTVSGGTVASTMTGFNPYARFELNERTSVWGVLGCGAGDLSLTPAGSEKALETDLTNAMAAFGGRTALSVRTGEAGRFELALRSDARLTNTASEAIEGLFGAEGRTARVRLVLEGSGSIPLSAGGVLKPRLEAGLRYDTGDAETGAGLEVGGGLGYAAGRLSVEVNARGLVAHEDTEYEEWGFSGSIAYTPSADGRGLSMRLGSAWGATQSGVQSLWSRQDASGLVSNAAFEAAQRYQVELRYGLDGKKGRARWEPFVGVESAAGASRALRLGVKLTSGRRLDAGLELGQRQGRPGADPEQAVQLRGALRW